MSPADSMIGFTFNARGQQYLTFRLAEEEYGLDVLRVQEIRGYSRLTPLPNTPREIKGVMNLRGAVVPVIDLRARLGLPDTEYTRFTVIIVVNFGRRVVGLVADAVLDVLSVPAREVVPVAELGPGVSASFLTGIARAGERLVTLLNIDLLVGKAV